MFFFQVGPGTPLASLLWDNSSLDMGICVKIQKIFYVFHIRSLDDNTIAKQVYLEQS